MEYAAASTAALLVVLGSIYYFREFFAGLVQMSRYRRMAAAGQEDQIGGQAGADGRWLLIAYFSWGGNTRRAAFRIHALTGGDIAEIRPQQPYPDGYKATTHQAQQEKVLRQRPPLQPFPADPAAYDVILLGYPLWWGTVPMAVRTFLEACHFDGKPIWPFVTSGGGTPEDSLYDLRLSAPEAVVKEPQLVNRKSRIRPWLRRAGLIR